MKFIVLPIENWNRELEAKIHLTQCIKQCSTSKIGVLLAPKNLVNLLMLKGLRGGSILHKSLQKHHELAVATSVKNSCSYYFLEEEALHRNIPFDIRYGINSSLVSGVFATSLLDYNSLANEFDESIIHKTGNPRTDFLFDTNKVHDERVAEIRQQYNDFVLFCSNFSYVFPPKDHRFENLETEGVWKTKKDREALFGYIEDHKKRALEVCDALKVISETQSVVYRPHPLESVKKAKAYFKGSNVQVFSDASVIPWLKTCAQLWHCGCTTAIEYALLGKTATFLLPLEQEVGGAPYKYSHICERLEDLEGASKMSRQPINTHIGEDLFGYSFWENRGHSTSDVAKILVNDAVNVNFLIIFYNVILLHILSWYFALIVKRSEKEAARICPDAEGVFKKWDRIAANGNRWNRLKVGFYSTFYFFN